MNHMDTVINLSYSMFFIISLIFLLAFLLKKFRGTTILGSKDIVLKGSVMIGNKEKLLLVDVADQRLLLGVTSHNIQTLLVLKQQAEFSQVMQKELQT